MEARGDLGNVGAPPVNIHSRTAPVRGADPRVECVLPWSASLAEGPFWSIDEQRLYWVDILAPAVHRFDPATGANETCPLRVWSAPPSVGGRVADRDTGEGVEELDFASRTLV